MGLIVGVIFGLMGLLINGTERSFWDGFILGFIFGFLISFIDDLGSFFRKHPDK